MRKIMLLISSVLFLFVQSNGQELSLPTPAPAAKVIKKIGGEMTNQFQTAVREMCNCPLFDLRGILELFAENSWIEVSTANGHGKKRFNPRDYFETVNSLKCGDDPLYKDMSFEYIPVSPSEAKVSSLDGSYAATFRIKQIFEGKSVGRRKRKNYCDLTIKEVVIGFWHNEKEELMAKIIGVFVVKTKKCDENDIYTDTTINR
jgi:hypothetical protein